MMTSTPVPSLQPTAPTVNRLAARALTRALALAIGLGAFTPTAYAVDDNIRLSNLYDEDRPDAYWNVASSTDRQLLYQNLARDLGMAVSTQMLSPGETLGAYGFELGLDTKVMALPATQRAYNSESTEQYDYDRADHWRVMDDDHRITLGRALALPTLRMRKGLPFSSEVGIDVTWIGFSHQAAFSGYGRVALHEGMWEREMRWLPDIAFTLAGTRFLGNSELDLSLVEWNVTLGYTFPVSGVRDSYVGNVSPFIGMGAMYISSSPSGTLPGRVDDLVGVTGLRGNAVSTPEDGAREVVFLESFQPWKFNMGIRVTSGMFRWVTGLEFTGAGLNDPITVGDKDYSPESGVLNRARITIGTGFIY